MYNGCREVIPMPRIMVAMKLTEAEKALLEKRVQVSKMTMSDYLRVCMLVDSVMDGDKDAIKLMAGNLRAKVTQRLVSLLGFDEKDVPVKA
jgi:hypothetical protein